MKVLGNVSRALQELKNDNNNAVAYVYENPESTNKSDKLANAVFTIKDVFATNDAPTQASSKILEGFNPHYNATVVQKLIDAGAIKVAKVHNDELALGGTGTFSAFGLITNPYDSTRLVGGSSSGSVATLTKNVSFALGSDTGDSVRLPASYNGVVGFKPSYGAISRYGMFAYASSLDTVSFFSHNVDDLNNILSCVYGVDTKDMTSVMVPMSDNISPIKPLKVPWLDELDKVEKFVANEYTKLIDKLNSLDIQVTKIDVNETLLRAIKPVYDIVSYSEASSNLSNLNGIAFGQRKDGETWSEIMTNTRSAGFGKMVQKRLVLGNYYLYSENQAEIFIKAQKVRRVIRDYLNNLHQNYDVVIFPASADVAPKIDVSLNKSHDYMDFILTGSNLGGNPSITIPWIQTSDNLFVNLALDAQIYHDEKLIGIAKYFENILGGVDEK
ncbi:amidase family protein [Mycoplasmopsis pullorum]|uniref:amidase family protein n=1 Tax=Mycoplasmopsis pullorum TaxID=48003 RepID=UPI001118F52D|nr:amidase family protein [Mycoplasmopsis pullorum]TNK82331.1 Asp-tRNA(Asn)/Glu-tRNA(Gln) amidotransferase subunit GatA [Mycoplasmopsis pullorum]